jgi:type IV fimbrial biogenesis protein FimT
MDDFTRLAGRQIHAGYTLLELLLSVSLLGVLLALAIPNFAKQISRQEISVQSRELRATLASARSEALMRQQDVYVCRRTLEGECDISPAHRADWSYGWIVFVDTNGNGRRDVDDVLLREITNHGSSTRVFMNHRGRLRFFPDGSSRSVGFWFCSTEGQYRYLALLRSGRSRLVSDSTDDGARECGPPGTA